MSSIARFSALAALLLAPLPTLHAQATPSDSAIHAILAARVDSGRTMGVVVGITENGRRRYIWHGTAGPARKPLGAHTIFEIGSITKTFNALTLADAVVRGEVRLDTPVSDLVPGKLGPAHVSGPITLEHLATHRSGLPRLPNNLRPADINDPYVEYDSTRLYEFLRTYALPRAPGALTEYSNLGAGLLGHALVRRTDAPSWTRMVQQRILGPLGMAETFVELPETERSRMAAGHNATLDTAPLWHFDALAGAGALRSTAADMLTYLEAQLAPRATPLAQAITLAQQPRAEFQGDARIALGWLVRGDSAASTWLHAGGTAGFSTLAAFVPARKLGVVVLSNAGVPIEDVAMHIIDPSSPLRMPPVPPRRTAITVPADSLELLVGEYPFAPTFVMSITRDGDALYLQATGQPRVRLWPSARDRFFIREVDAQLVFSLDETGRATAVTLVQNGREQKAPRRPEP